MRTLIAALLATLPAACAAPEPTQAAMSDVPASEGACTVLFDLSRAGDRDAWRAENDTVMGGNSDGDVTGTDDSLVFAGELVTRGGGFVQMNAPLPDGALDGMTSLRLVASSGGRPWQARVQTGERVPRRAMRGGGDEGDAQVTRSGPDMDGPRVAFSVPIEGLPTEAPGPVTVPFDAPEATTRGRPVPDATWNPADARSLGLILADGEDAPFRLEVRRIEVCR